MSGILSFTAMAQAIALRFDPTTTTPPAGAEPITLATEALPAAIKNEPVVFVFPPDVELHYSGHIRTGIATFSVRLYIYRATRDTARNSSLLLAWADALYSQFDGAGDAYASLPTYVTSSYVTGVRSGGILRYNGETFHGVEFTVRLTFQEALP